MIIDIEQNRRRFLEIFQQKVRRNGMTRMLSWLSETDFFEAPASAGHHLAVPGGLVAHSLNVYDTLRSMVPLDTVPPISLAMGMSNEQMEESMAIVALLHDVCKCNLYHYNGTQYRYRDSLPLGHGEKSLYLVARHMDLKPFEAMAIRWHMGEWDDAVRGGCSDAAAAASLSVWVSWLQKADNIAAHQEDTWAVETAAEAFARLRAQREEGEPGNE